MKIDVTAEDIAKGVVLNSDGCPVARAISRATGKPTSVGLHWLHKPYYMPLPEVVAANIIRMTIGESVEPFSFDLEIP